MSHASIFSPADLPSPSARPIPRPSRGDGWNVLADIEVFIFAVEAELEAMDRERIGVHRRGRKPDLSVRRRLWADLDADLRRYAVADRRLSLSVRPGTSPVI